MNATHALTDDQASQISRLAAAYGSASLSEGMASKIPGEEETWRKCSAETARAWQELQDLIWNLARGEDFPSPEDASGGVKSFQTGPQRPINEIEGWVPIP